MLFTYQLKQFIVNYQSINTYVFAYLTVAAKYQVTSYPSVLLFESGSAKKYLGDLKHSVDNEINDIKRASNVKEWVLALLEAQDRIVIKEITPEAFKDHPNEYKHVS